MESFFGNSPWDFGTGFTSPFTADPSSFQPVQPQTDLASGLAKAFASQGIRPDQFLQNPAGAAQTLQQNSPPPAGSNPWDTTPVDTPGGPPVSLGGRVAQAPNPNVQTDDASQANAAASPEQQGQAKGGIGDRLTEALKGVKMPQPPTPQKVSTPAAPQMHSNVKGGQLMALLSALSPAANQVAVPLSLGRSIR